MFETRTSVLPPLSTIERRLPAGDPVDIGRTLESAWCERDLAARAAGKSVAIGIGSRGIARISEIAACLARLVKDSGGFPFIVPAMGSHGGGTAEGQLEVLAGLGVTGDSVGCPLRATMDVVVVGSTEQGWPLHLDRNVAEADALIVANRIKVHTDFHGPHESGLLKMLAIGLGKERGAAWIHRYGVPGLREMMPQIGTALLQHVNLLAGVATIEDGYHRPVELSVFSAEDLVAGEQCMLQRSRELMPRLPVDDIDLLVIDRMGKEISGAGMDTNIIGRWMMEGEPEPEAPRVRAIVVLDLTEATHGNATGIGLADFMTRRLYEKIDLPLTTLNVFTSGGLLRGKLPLVYEDDEQTIDMALRHVFRKNPEDRESARVVRISSTLDLESVQVSPSVLRDIQDAPDLISATEPCTPEWHDGRLTPL
ncbi:MAG: DUF362 domain-containing protein [Anaerolineaceae bacterium]|nr:DUF362 domain-containing protein [Anaerolineaceae bacterium]